MTARFPHLGTERGIIDDVGSLIAVDEVGRGALSGPVTIGAVRLQASQLKRSRRPPAGVKDSKLLSAAMRSSLVGPLQEWVPQHAVGHASAAEIDAFGITTALRLAGIRAIAALPPAGAVLLDGSFDYLSYVQPSLLDLLPGESLADPVASDPVLSQLRLPPVRTLIKADLRCTSVAAASVLAKTTRDAIMTDLDADYPDYGWARNKGYSSADHIEALRRIGPCPLHRRSWRLPGVALRDGTAIPVAADVRHNDVMEAPTL